MTGTPWHRGAGPCHTGREASLNEYLSYNLIEQPCQQFKYRRFSAPIGANHENELGVGPQRKHCRARGDRFLDIVRRRVLMCRHAYVGVNI